MTASELKSKVVALGGRLPALRLAEGEHGRGARVRLGV
jgi:hypothetical protein